jgi:transposase-like protein
MGAGRLWTNEQLIEAVKTSQTMKEIAKKLGYSSVQTSYKTVRKWIENLHLDTSHLLSTKEQLKKDNHQETIITI